MKVVLIVLAIGIVLYFAKQFLNAGKAKENIELGQQFLAKKAEVDGVITTASGLQYLKLEDGAGTTNPTATDRLRCTITVR